MSESFRGSSGRKVISRATAKHLGDVSHLLVDAGQKRVAAVVIGFMVRDYFVTKKREKRFHSRNRPSEKTDKPR